jgi:endonuclease YncB( thermonuclease family)
VQTVRSPIVVVVALVVASVGGWWLGHEHRAIAAPYRVVDVLDGDTIVVSGHGHGKETIRLLGVDTP